MDKTYSNWVAAAYMGGAFNHLSEGLAGLERAMKMAGMTPSVGIVTPGVGPIPCIPGFTCRTDVPELRRVVDEIKLTLPDMISAVESLLDQAGHSVIPDFEVVVGKPLGPAPDQPGDVDIV